MPPDLPSSQSLENCNTAAGAEKTRVFVHSSTLTMGLKPLRSMAAVLEEATVEQIDFSGWDLDTVKRLAEFQCKGTYKVPEQTPGEEAYEDEEVFEGRDGMMTPCSVQSSEDREEHSQSVLLAHAKVYALAQSKDMKELEDMALGGLRVSLEGITMSGKGVRDVIDLLRYVYSYTDRRTGSHEEIRGLVSTFAAKNFESLTNRPLWYFLGQQGDLAFDVMGKLSERASHVEKKAERLENDATELGEKMQQLEIANLEEINKVPDLKTLVAGMRRLLVDWIARSGVASIPVSLAAVFLIVTVAFIAIVAIVSTQNSVPILEPPPALPSPTQAILSTQPSQTTREAPPTEVVPPTDEFLPSGGILQPQTPYWRSFEGICQYYEAFSWAGSTFVTIGEKPLKEACLERSRVGQPLSALRETTEDICQFYKTSLWFGSNTYSIQKEWLKEACIKYIFEMGLLEGKSTWEIIRTFKDLGFL